MKLKDLIFSGFSSPRFFPFLSLWWCVQYNILTGRYPCEISDYIMLGGIQARLELGPYDMSIHTPSFFRWEPMKENWKKPPPPPRPSTQPESPRLKVPVPYLSPILLFFLSRFSFNPPPACTGIPWFLGAHVRICFLELQRSFGEYLPKRNSLKAKKFTAELLSSMKNIALI